MEHTQRIVVSVFLFLLYLKIQKAQSFLPKRKVDEVAKLGGIDFRP